MKNTTSTCGDFGLVVKNTTNFTTCGEKHHMCFSQCRSTQSITDRRIYDGILLEICFAAPSIGFTLAALMHWFHFRRSERWVSLSGLSLSV